ncbi:hypothetical protein IQ255_00090 [Pleurocapsales cyanobacterium LEGE 10410]|nr:hypothetical protein [Pleurocapsales cyanobacterium LEGE 10410]
MIPKSSEGFKNRHHQQSVTIAVTKSVKRSPLSSSRFSAARIETKQLADQN